MQLDLIARRIVKIEAGVAVTLHLSGGVIIYLESAFQVFETATAAPMSIDPANLRGEPQCEVLLRGRVVESAWADEEIGQLTIAFQDGVALKVAADPDFEAWSVSWLDGSMVLALPGGGLTCWSPRP